METVPDGGGGGGAAQPKNGKWEREGVTDQTAEPLLPESPLVQLFDGRFPDLREHVLRGVNLPGLGRLRQANKAVKSEVTQTRTWLQECLKRLKRLFPRGVYELVLGVTNFTADGYTLTINGIRGDLWCAQWDKDLLKVLTPGTRRRVADAGLHVNLAEEQDGPSLECWAVQVFGPALGISAPRAATAAFAKVVDLLADARTVTLTPCDYGEWDAIVGVFPNATHVKFDAFDPRHGPLPEWKERGIAKPRVNKVDPYSFDNKLWRGPTRVSFLHRLDDRTAGPSSWSCLPDLRVVAFALYAPEEFEAGDGPEMIADYDACCMMYARNVGIDPFLQRPHDTMWLVPPGGTARLEQSLTSSPGVFDDRFSWRFAPDSITFWSPPGPSVGVTTTVRDEVPSDADNPARLVRNQ